MRKGIAVVILIISTLHTVIAQTKDTGVKDTIDRFHSHLQEITVIGRNSKSDIQQLPEVVGTSIYAGKKTALIVLDNVKGNIVTNSMRQVLAKVPGIHVWESDGSGIQIGISARGLSPNRSWEFNVRQNGYDIAADPFGYPEAYYNPQLQAVQRIEVVRGQGSLQYGPQFGGMVNYILRNGSEINKPIEFETQQTVGTAGLFNSYTAIGGETKNLHYYAFFDHRNGNGWRQNSSYFTNAGYGTLSWRVNPKLTITAELMQSHIRSQQPGGLTDAQFASNSKLSTRSRNWIDISWTTAAVIANYQLSPNTKFNIKLFGVAGNRNSVGYLKAITIGDTIVRTTQQYNNRVVDIDQYRNAGLEARFISTVKLGTVSNTIAGGIRLYTGTTYRFRDGLGTTGSSYTIERVDGIWPRDIQFRSHNGAAFIEDIIKLSDKLSLIPGIRYEYLVGTASGRNGYLANGQEIVLQNEKRGRGFLLAGMGAEWHVNNHSELYANITQAYRPIQFADLTAPPTTDKIDPNIKDAKGYNIDFGYRGRLNAALLYDVSAFYLQYDNRIGSITQQRQDGSFYNYRTNVGNSSSKGFELFAEAALFELFSSRKHKVGLSVFASYGYTDAQYGNLIVITKNSSNQLVETNLKNKKVENAPSHIVRTGTTITYSGIGLTLQHSYVSETFSDANNTLIPSENGQTGLIPSYHITDISANYTFLKKLFIKSGINNLFDKRYFTRRAGGYPGPGLMPSDGRNFFVTVGCKL